MQNEVLERLVEEPKRMVAARRPRLAAVRISPGGYFAAAALLTFVSLVCLRTNRDLLALILVVATWSLIPLLDLTDRLSFDGSDLRRTGLLAWACRIVGRPVLSIAADDIERV